MKKYLLFIPALLFSMMGFSQGIEFEHGTWKEVLAKAQQTNKPIFVDVYTSWCGPCKMMSKEIFPLEDVGKVYNANFICYQIDAEKGEGVEIANRYEVKEYPTYLFIKAKGALFYKASGSRRAEAFIDVSKLALTEINDPRSLIVLEKEYAKKKNDPSFLLSYMDKRSKLRLSNAQVFDQYLKLIPEKDRVADTIIKLYEVGQSDLKINSFAFENLQKNIVQYSKKYGEKVYYMFYSGIMNTIPEAAKSKNEKLFAAALSKYDQLPSQWATRCFFKDELYMRYYKISGDTAKYLNAAINLANNHLMKISDDSIVQWDKVNSQNIERRISSKRFADMDSGMIARVRDFYSNMERNHYSQYLNDIAWEVFQNISDKKILLDALGWSKRSLELLPNNCGWLDTYANLLYKLGRKEEAIAKEEEALRYIKKEDVHKSQLEETLRKMKAGEKTWKSGLSS